MSRPNILVMMTDQQQAGVMSCAGDVDVHTPAMDSIARRGMRFSRAYTNFPLCAPMRASMISGQYPHQLGITGNVCPPWTDAFPSENVLGRRLSDVGYRCVWAGKDRVLPDWGYEKLCGYGDVQTADHLVRFLDEHDAETPFFAVGVFQNPHNIAEWSRGQPLFEGPIPQEPHVDELPLLPANFEPCPYEAEAIDLYARSDHANYYHGDRHHGDLLYWRRHRWAYRRLIERVDAQIGRILAALEARGLRDDTIVIFTSDHGDCDGAHRWSSKSVLFEEAVRIPLVVEGPGIAAGRVDDTHLINVAMDHVPTILDCAGLAAPDWVDADCRSYLPVARGAAPDEWRQTVMIETTLPTTQGNGKPPYGAARAIVRSDGMKYCCYWQGQHREQLFDLNRDPGEMVNLAVNRRYDDSVADMRLRLRHWCDRTADPFRFQIPGHEILSPGSGAW